MQETINPLSERSYKRKRYYLIGCVIGFAIAGILALIIGLAVGLHHHHDHYPHQTPDNSKTPLSPQRRANGSEVHWWFWGQDPYINAFVDRVYGAPLLSEFNITLVPIYLNATAQAVEQVAEEYNASNTKDGAVDLIWINGENFFAMKNAGQLWGPFAQTLPLASTVDYNNTAISFDFGEPTDGFESVWSAAHYQFIYDPARTPVDSLPRNFSQWLAFAQANPGKTTYVFPDATDFIGTRFIKQAFLDLAPKGYFSGSTFNQTRFDEYAPQLWKMFNDVKPHLWNNGTVMPSRAEDLDYLFGHNLTDFTVTNDVTGAQTGIDEGYYPADSKAFIWHSNSIGDFNYVAIPGNSAHIPAALVLANLILRPDRQALQKIPSEGFALGFGIDYNRLDVEGQTTLSLADKLLGNASVDSAELSQYLVSDLNPLYHAKVIDGWLTNVGPGVTTWTSVAQ